MKVLMKGGWVRGGEVRAEEEHGTFPSDFSFPSSLF